MPKKKSKPVPFVVENPKPKKLTPMQKMFCSQYIVDLNGTQAAIRTGYSKHTANEQAARLLANVSIKDEIERLKNSQLTRVEIKADDVLREIAKIAFSDIRKVFKEDGSLVNPSELSDEAAAFVSSVETEELYDGVGRDRERVGDTKKVKLYDKLRALEQLGKHLKLFTDKIEVEAGQTLAAMLAKTWEDNHDQNS